MMRDVSDSKGTNPHTWQRSAARAFSAQHGKPPGAFRDPVILLAQAFTSSRIPNGR